MPIADRIQDAVAQREADMKAAPGFLDLQKFYEDMRRLGIAIKQDYTLPQLDTIGKGLSALPPVHFRNTP